jgi:drug/metabolite transporter (DMT)-like permease
LPFFIVVVLLWGSSYSLVKIALSFASPSTLLLQRFLVSAAVVLPIFLLLRKKFPHDRRTLVRLTIYCLIYVSVNTAQVLGLVQGSSGIGAVITYTQPLFVLCLAAPFLKERITTHKILGAAFGFAGVAILFLNKTGSLVLSSSLLMLLSAFLWALSVMYYKRFLSQADPLVPVLLQLIIGSIVFSALDLGANSFAFPMNTQYVAIVLYSSAGGLALGNIFWLRLLRDEEATTLSSSFLLVPAVALVFGWYFLGESLNVESFLGSALILGGVYLTNLSKNDSQQSLHSAVTSKVGARAIFRD